MHVGYYALVISMRVAAVIPDQSGKNFGHFRSIPSVSNSNRFHVVNFRFIFIVGGVYTAIMNGQSGVILHFMSHMINRF